MSLRRMIVNLIVIWLGIMGIACGMLCLICLILYVFWQGLGISTVALSLLCLFCLGLAVMLSTRAANNREVNHLKGVGLRSLKSWWRRLPDPNGSSVTGSTSGPHAVTHSESGEPLDRFSTGRASVPRAMSEADWQQEFNRYRDWSMQSDDEHCR